ncbi:MAG TPA: winged helix-turn-helix domain-containing protein [Longimicrobiaceae bacterium]|nr:winged helix-turn-helix domain-containing protein [Longimicrobiaceae bacterium]
MAQHLRVADHLSPEQLKQRFQSAHDPVERTHFQVLYLASLHWRSADIAEAVGYSIIWIRKLVRRYNEGGPPALEDQRHHNPGQPRLLSPEQEAALEQRLRTPPEDGGLWSGPKVAQWMSQQLGRRVAEVRGWEVLRRLGYRPLRPRRRHVRADPQAQESFPAGAAGAPSG